MSTSHFKLTIPKPCTEDWNTMTPSEAGRFCSSCKKHVIDFTVLSDTEIQNYFIKNSTQPVCGHFRKTQLERIRIQLPSYFFQKKIPVWQKYLIVFLICFGSNLYSVDLTIGSKQSGLYAQTTSKNSKHKKAKKKKNRNEFNDVFIRERFLDGVVARTPVNQPHISTPFTFFDDTSSTKKDSSNAEVSMSSAINTNNPESPQEKKPKRHWEFLLPVPFTLRKRN